LPPERERDRGGDEKWKTTLKGAEAERKRAAFCSLCQGEVDVHSIVARRSMETRWGWERDDKRLIQLTGENTDWVFI
jgi:hypothetical protein